MIIKDSEWQKCSECGKPKLIRAGVLGCDHCGKELDFGSAAEYLSCTNFHQNGEHEEFDFCSWHCYFAKLRKIEIDEFMHFPYLTPDTVQEFWAAARSTLINPND